MYVIIVPFSTSAIPAYPPYGGYKKNPYKNKSKNPYWSSKTELDRHCDDNDRFAWYGVGVNDRFPQSQAGSTIVVSVFKYNVIIFVI